MQPSVVSRTAIRQLGFLGAELNRFHPSFLRREWRVPRGIYFLLGQEARVRIVCHDPLPVGAIVEQASAAHDTIGHGQEHEVGYERTASRGVQ